MEASVLLSKDVEFEQLDELYDECLDYLKSVHDTNENETQPTVVHNKTGELITNNRVQDTSNETSDNYEHHYEDNKDLFYSHKSNLPNDIYERKLIGFIDDVEDDMEDPVYEIIKPINNRPIETENEMCKEPSKIGLTVENEICQEPPKTGFKVENEMYHEPSNMGLKLQNNLKSNKSISSLPNDIKSERLRRLSQQLPRIIVTHSSTSLNLNKKVKIVDEFKMTKNDKKKAVSLGNFRNPPPLRNRTAYGEHPKRLVSKSGIENVALISNVPYEKIRLLNDTFHTLINLRWRWIVMGTVVVHFAIWLVFAVFWYITALAHYDFEPDPPKRTCVTGGKDFVTIFLASVEAQTTIGFGDRTIDEECPESIFLFIMQLILGTGLSGVLTCVVYAKLTRPEKLSRDGVGFSKKAVISVRDGKLCLMMRAWDLNYDHIISSEFTAHFVSTHRTKEGEMLRYYARTLPLQHKQFLLWPVTLVHEIDEDSPFYMWTPEHFASSSYEVTLGLKGASASMGTFTQSQTSYLPREVVWGHRFLPVVKYDIRKQKYVIEHKKLDAIEPVDTPRCSAADLYSVKPQTPPPSPRPGTPNSFSDKISTFHLERSSSFRKKDTK